LRAILERGAATVSVALTAEAALRLAETERFAVAVIDLRLPGRDGLATMHALRLVQPWLQIIIVTAYPSPTTMRTALTEGAAAYLEKPYAPDALRALVETLLDRAEAE
jgi:DNA-binding NtrC family response regulator